MLNIFKALQNKTSVKMYDVLCILTLIFSEKTAFLLLFFKNVAFCNESKGYLK